MQRTLPITPEDTGYTLHNAATSLIAKMMPDLWEMIEHDAFDPKPQDNFGSYFPRDSQRINQINWQYAATSIRNVIRALAPPMAGAYSYLDETRCILGKVICRPSDLRNKVPGEISFQDNEVLIATGQDFLAVESIIVDGIALDGPAFYEKYLRNMDRPMFRSLPDERLSDTETIAMEGGQPACQKYIFFGLPSLGEEEEQAVIETMRSQWIGMGNKTLEFESRFAEYVGSRWALSTSSCTAALHLALLALGVGPGDEVITTPLTFVATANAIEYTGARPVFVDIDPETLNIDPNRIEAAITPRTKAILPVHYGGLPVDMAAIEALAAKHRLRVLYDAAHAVGGAYQGVNIGGGNHITSFSFYPNKNMTTCEGGMITGNDEAILSELKLLRQHGLRDNAWQRYQTKRIILYETTKLGYKYNLTDLQSAIGLVQLGKLECFQKRREQIALYYNSQIRDMQCVQGCYHPELYGHSRHALHLYVVLLDMQHLCTDRNQIAAALREENIGVGIHYLPIHRHKYYREKYALSPDDYPVADRVGDSCITLPTNPTMSHVDAAMVIKALRKVLKWYSR
jgi:dTDP-4-amino-4,6-dideoxygalactose transaminase